MVTVLCDSVTVLPVVDSLSTSTGFRRLLRKADFEGGLLKFVEVYKKTCRCICGSWVVGRGSWHIIILSYSR